MKLAILDDYQGVALNSVDWSEVSKRVDITVFKDHLHDEGLIAERLKDFERILGDVFFEYLQYRTQIL